MTRRLPGVLVLAITAACSAPQETQMPALSDYPPYVPTVVEATDIPPDIFRDSWARVPVPDRDTLDAEGKRAWDVIVNPESRYSEGPRGPTTAWLYSPVVAQHIFPASTYLRYGTGKDQRLTELTILSTAREVKNQYEWSSHEPLAQRAGLEQQIIDLVRDRGDVEAAVPGLGETERTIIRFAREVLSEEKVSPETYAAAERLFGQKGVMDLAGLIGYYGFVNVTLKAFDVQLPPGRERLLPPLW